MPSNIDKLLSIASHPFSSGSCKDLNTDFNFVNNKLLTELEYIYSNKNGFYAFESALCFYTCEPNDLIIDIFNWNNLNDWKSAYSPNLDRVLLFAEDVFANQFGLTEAHVVRFDPETGEILEHSNSLEIWAKKICEDYDYETGWSLAKEWQVANGRLRNGYRLLPKRPFVMGGEYEMNNLVAVKKVDAMQAYGSLYNQIKNIPDGKEFVLHDWIGVIEEG